MSDEKDLADVFVEKLNHSKDLARLSIEHADAGDHETAWGLAGMSNVILLDLLMQLVTAIKVDTEGATNVYLQ